MPKLGDGLFDLKADFSCVDTTTSVCTHTLLLIRPKSPSPNFGIYLVIITVVIVNNIATTIYAITIAIMIRTCICTVAIVAIIMCHVVIVVVVSILPCLHVRAHALAHLYVCTRMNTVLYLIVAITVPYSNYYVHMYINIHQSNNYVRNSLVQLWRIACEARACHTGSRNDERPKPLRRSSSGQRRGRPSPPHVH